MGILLIQNSESEIIVYGSISIPLIVVFLFPSYMLKAKHIMHKNVMQVDLIIYILRLYLCLFSCYIMVKLLYKFLHIFLIYQNNFDIFILY